MSAAPPAAPARRIGLAIGTAVFFVIAPGTVAGWIPWALTRWRVGPALLGIEAGRWFGGVLVAAGALVVIECFARFVTAGIGTPAPVAPTRHLVVSGLYRHVRNPMYVGVVAAILGQALLLGSTALLRYAAIVWVGFTAFVMIYEEPTLRRSFGTAYQRYCAHVGRWWPRLRPWHGSDTAAEP